MIARREPKLPPDVDMDDRQELMTRASHWKFDLNIPVAILGAFALQTGTAIWWASSINSRVDLIERQQTMAAPQSDRLTRVEVKLDALTDAVKEVKDFLRQQQVKSADH